MPETSVQGYPLGICLGGGSFGKVYRSRHQVLDIDVAVKVVNGRHIDASGLEQTLREARLMARLDHPNLLRIYDAGRTDDAVYFVLELMDCSLAGVHRLSPERALSVSRQLLLGLQALHDARILHRDIKPGNCLLRHADWRVKLGDLGIAVDWGTVGGRTDIAGTLPFMAPELFSAPPRYGPVSDLYALGMTLACLFLDHPPYPGGGFEAFKDWSRAGTRPQLSALRPDLPVALTHLVERMLAPGEQHRPASVADALGQLSAHQPMGSVSESPFPETMPTGMVPETSKPGAEVPTAARPGAEYLTTEQVGPWILGDVVYQSQNWVGRVATHARTGRSARFVHLAEDAYIADHSVSILAAAERAADLDHPAILDTLDWGMLQDRVYVVTNSQGACLDELLAAGRPTTEEEAVGFMLPVAEALVYLHSRGLVYQMLDPGSVMISPDARSTCLSWPVFCVPAGTLVQSPAGISLRFFIPRCAPPEVIFSSADRIDPSVDLYGLGATLYRCLVPTEEQKLAGREVEVMRERFPEVTAPLMTLITRLLHVDPQSRPTAAEACQALHRISRRLGVTTSGVV
jgi:serine/threonine protein kinase